MGTLLRSTALWGYRELVHELGADPEAFMARFGIARGVERQDDAFISYAAYVHLLEASADELDCPDFALRLSQWQGLDILGPVAVIARNAHTVLDGWEAIARYLYAHSPALRLTLAPQASEPVVTFTYEVIEPDLVVIQGYEISMANAARITHLLGGPDARFNAIVFMHDQQGIDAAYREALECPVRFGQAWSGFELSPQLAARRIDGADPETMRIATKYLESQYLPPTTSLSERVAELSRRLLPTGQCSVDAIASQLAVHPRTLQRRLAEEGVRCQDVIERERREQAARYLAEPELRLGQIASLVGYAEQSALNRSCRRWFGKTPRQYRAELRV